MSEIYVFVYVFQLVNYIDKMNQALTLSIPESLQGPSSQSGGGDGGRECLWALLDERRGCRTLL
jgi:hypothetical protein